MTTVTANFGTYFESVDVPTPYTEDAVYDFFDRGAIAVAMFTE